MTTFLRTALAVLALATVFAVNAEARPGRSGGNCAWAARELSEAESDYQHASAMVMNNSSLCPGGWNSNAACMQTIANNYNRALTRLQRAQNVYNSECR